MGHVCRECGGHGDWVKTGPIQGASSFPLIRFLNHPSSCLPGFLRVQHRPLQGTRRQGLPQRRALFPQQPANRNQLMSQQHPQLLSQAPEPSTPSAREWRVPAAGVAWPGRSAALLGPMLEVFPTAQPQHHGPGIPGDGSASEPAAAPAPSLPGGPPRRVVGRSRGGRARAGRAQGGAGRGLTWASHRLGRGLVGRKRSLCSAVWQRHLLHLQTPVPGEAGREGPAPGQRWAGVGATCARTRRPARWPRSDGPCGRGRPGPDALGDLSSRMHCGPPANHSSPAGRGLGPAELRGRSTSSRTPD